MIEPGSRIEHYTVIEKIGQGGQATVWSAHDERLKRTVAIKTIGVNAAADSSTAPGSTLTTPDRFREEAEIIALLEHPNILPIYGFGQEGELLYIVMRYMPSGSLRDLIHQEGNIPLDEAIVYLEPLAGALDLAHEQRIIHRDLKSANILLDAQRHPYLADFGLSMTMDTKPSETSGTLNYMSPEQMMGVQLDGRSDLYAFGIMVFELLTGHTPRVNGQPWNVFQMANKAGVLPISPLLTPEVTDVLNHATTYDREKRYSTATEFITALKAVVQPGQAKGTVSPTPSDPAQQAFQEAKALFGRALERWADGAGRFRLEAGDFKYIVSFFDDFDIWDITIDGPTLRLLLRAALEHGYEVEKWWAQLPKEADRRAVTLQTLTSDYPAARIRALERLIDLPDSQPPAIPIRVATVLKTERDPGVLLAGIRVLEARNKSDRWRSDAYSETIDATLAGLAKSPSSEVAEAAARACARIRSTSALMIFADGTRSDPAMLRALIYARDEVPAFPAEIAPSLRATVFALLSIQQFLANPLSLVTRYAGAALGYSIGLGIVVYALFDNGNGLLAAQQFGNAAAVGVLYGALTGLGVTAAIELPSRLRVWSRPGRIVLGWLTGTSLGAMAFGAFHSYFYFDPVPAADWPKFLIAIAVLMSGYAISAGLTRRAVLRALGGATGVLLAVFFSWYIYSMFTTATFTAAIPLITLADQDEVSILLSLGVAIFAGGVPFLAIEGLRTRRFRGRNAR
jgi:serine/threonine protein kinase